jgi:hypothetical protein
MKVKVKVKVRKVRVENKKKRKDQRNMGPPLYICEVRTSRCSQGRWCVEEEEE